MCGRRTRACFTSRPRHRDCGDRIRFDLPAENMRFLPWGRDWDVHPQEAGSRADVGKYSPRGKGDYLRSWPGRPSAPPRDPLRWRRTRGSRCIGIRLDPHGARRIRAALTVHLLAVHLPQRWWNAPGLPRAILTGTVPLGEAESGGMGARARRTRVLVPAPERRRARRNGNPWKCGNSWSGGTALREMECTARRALVREALRLLPEYSQARFNLAVALLRTAEAGKQGAADDLHRERPVQPDGGEGKGDARGNRKGNDVSAGRGYFSRSSRRSYPAVVRVPPRWSSRETARRPQRGIISRGKRPFHW